MGADEVAAHAGRPLASLIEVDSCAKVLDLADTNSVRSCDDDRGYAFRIIRTVFIEYMIPFLVTLL